MIENLPTTPVNVEGFSWGAAAGWSTFILLLTAIGAFAKAMGPARLYEIWAQRDESLRAEQKEEELSDASKLKVAEGRATSAESKVVYLSSALSLLIGVMESLDPHNPALAQARELVAMASDGDDGFSRSLKRLASAPDSPGKPKG